MTLQLELGKKYLNRRGEVVKVVEHLDYAEVYVWEGSNLISYTNNGLKWYGDSSPEDLISECVEPSAESLPTNNKVPHKHGTSVPNNLGTKVPHLHADLIIAWAQGETIEYLDEEDGEFYFTGKPSWDNDTVYRIKPEKKVEQTYALITTSGALDTDEVEECNVKFTFEDGKLIKAEVL